MREALDKGEDAAPFLFGRNGALLRRIVEGASVGMAVAGMDGKLVYANRAFRSQFVSRPGPSDNLHELFAPDDGEGRRALSDLLAGWSESYQGEHRCRDREGRSVWASVALAVLASEVTGDAIYVVAQVSSIEQLKVAQAALAESESRWHFALEAARQGVWDHDGRTGRMFYSPMWRTMRGIPEDEVIDDRQEAWLARLHPDDRERIRATVSRQNRGEDGYDTLEYRERHRDGRYIWILSRGKPVEWDADGNVLRTVGTDTDITRLKEIEARLEYAATHDALTGLANRPSLSGALAAAIATPPACLLFIDLDQFKPINDALGHAAGDAVLVAVAECIRASIRKADIAGRIGGDEFAVLLVDCEVDSARRAAEAMLDAVASIPITLAGRPHRLGASIGLVRLSEDADVEALFARADAACYAAKKAGRGRIVVAG